MVIFNPYIIALFLSETIILIFAFIAFCVSLKISLTLEKNSKFQNFALYKKGYLVSTILMFLLGLKILLFIFFIWVMDEISPLIPGAMCAVGVVDGTNFGFYMFMLKIVNLFLLIGWIYIHYLDSQTKTSEFFLLKFKFFIIIFVFLVFEYIFSLLHFINLNFSDIVRCCSELFKSSEFGTASFLQNEKFIVFTFYTLAILSLISALFKNKTLFGITSVLFSAFAIYAVIRFFSPYIYELPLHKCPFCMLKQNYYFIGYIIYILIFTNATLGLFALICKFLNLDATQKVYKIYIFTTFGLILVLSFYPLKYYLNNGVWL
ncbi:MAG: hypothetical protein MR902_03060 [Campylobacter sp.]|nr:hypothetical protein [Campylobacter sp.]